MVYNAAILNSRHTCYVGRHVDDTCHNSGKYSHSSQHEDPSSIPGLSVWELWCSNAIVAGRSSNTPAFPYQYRSTVLHTQTSFNYYRSCINLATDTVIQWRLKRTFVLIVYRLGDTVAQPIWLAENSRILEMENCS